jgi:hypothetical protein
VEATEVVGVSAHFGEKISDRNVEMEVPMYKCTCMTTSFHRRYRCLV